MAAWLLAVRDPGQLTAHPLRGALFENWAINELLKARLHGGLKPNLFFLRDKAGHEIDAVIEIAPKRCVAVEIKSGATIGGDFFSGLDFWRENLPGTKLQPWLIYGGTSAQTREKGAVAPWSDLSPLLRAAAV